MAEADGNRTRLTEMLSSTPVLKSGGGRPEPSRPEAGRYARSVGSS
jgi:hypothetical protein